MHALSVGPPNFKNYPPRLFMLIFPRDVRVAKWLTWCATKTAKVAGRGFESHYRIGVILKLAWGPNNLSPATWYVEIWVCEQGITLKLAWGPSNSSPKKSCEVFLIFISACLDFPDHFFFLFPARNSLLVLLFPTFGTFLTFHQR